MGMSSEWSTRTFSELMDKGVLEIGDGYRAKNDELGGDGIIFLRAGHVKDSHVDFAGVDRFKTADQSKFGRKIAKAGDVVITTKGNSTGRLAVVTPEMPSFVYSPHLSYWRSISSSVIDQGFLRAWARSDEFSAQLAALSRSTDMAPYLSLSDQRRLQISLPTISAQREIAVLNDAVSKRLELLRETNATLEAIAQALFKSWFVDFDPVRAKMEGRAPEGMDEATAALFPDGFEELELGAVPKGWNLVPLSSALEINPTRKLKKGELAPYLDMASVGTQGHVADETVLREMGSGSKFRNGDTLLARITPCLENGKTAFVDCLPEGATGWGSTEFVVLRPKSPLPEYFAYLLCRHGAFREFAIQSMSGTSGRQRIQNDVLSRHPVAVPTSQVAEAFGSVVSALQQRIAANHASSQTLSTLRDTLLPRLISGQLRLPEAQAAMEAALA
jgi:type I restriction enzyme S subunit